MDDKTWQLLIDRLEGIEGGLEKLDKRVSSVVQFKWWIMGAAAAMSVGSSTIIGTMNGIEGIDNSEIYFRIPKHPPSILLDEQDARDIRSQDSTMETKRHEEGSVRHSGSSPFWSLLGDRS